jgi:hypothetical protein
MSATRRKDSVPYLKPERLPEVLALIQVLSVDECAHRSEHSLRIDLQGSPTSAATWTDLACQHPEFFRVRPDGDNRVSLIARHVLQEDATGRRPALPHDFLYELMRTALAIRDRQIAWSERWSRRLTVAAAIIAAVAATWGVILQMRTRAHDLAPAQPAPHKTLPATN